MNRFPTDDLLKLLEDRATLFSGSRFVRSDLVKRTLLAADRLEMEPGANIEDELFLLMHRIADNDEQEFGIS